MKNSSSPSLVHIPSGISRGLGLRLEWISSSDFRELFPGLEIGDRLDPFPVPYKPEDPQMPSHWVAEWGEFSVFEAAAAAERLAARWNRRPAVRRFRKALAAARAADAAAADAETERAREAAAVAAVQAACDSPEPVGEAVGVIADTARRGGDFWAD